MDKIVELGKRWEKKKAKNPVDIKNGNVEIKFSEDSDFIFAYANHEAEDVGSYIGTDDPEEAICLLICLLQHIQRNSECTKGELISTIVELFVDSDNLMLEDDEDGN